MSAHTLVKLADDLRFRAHMTWSHYHGKTHDRGDCMTDTVEALRALVAALVSANIAYLTVNTKQARIVSSVVKDAFDAIESAKASPRYHEAFDLYLQLEAESDELTIGSAYRRSYR